MKYPSRIYVQGWAGITTANIKILGETPKKYRVELLDDEFKTPSNGPMRHKGDIFLVPKHAVRGKCDDCAYTGLEHRPCDAYECCVFQLRDLSLTAEEGR